MRSRWRYGRWMLAALIASAVDKSSLEAQGNPPHLTATRELIIDGAVADLTFITYMTVLHDGTMMVAQPEDARILYFSPSGTLSGSFGRSGEGPREFHWIAGLGWVGDTVWAWDDTQRRMTFLARGKEFLRTERFAKGMRPARGDAKSLPLLLDIAPIAQFGNGESLRWGMAASVPQPAPWKGLLPPGATVFGRTHGDGTLTEVVAFVPSTSQLCRDQRLNVAIPECAHPQWSVAPDGSRLAVATPILRGRGAPAIRLVQVSAHGDTLLDRQYPFTPVHITAHMADSIRARLIKNSGPRSIAGIRAVAMPSVLAPIEEIVLGHDASVWIGLHSTGATRSWMIVDQLGELRGTVSLPEGVRVRVVDHDLIWGTSEDLDGVESIVRFRIAGRR